MAAAYIDIESESRLDLTKVGVYQYAAHPSTRVQMLSALYLGVIQQHDFTLDPNVPQWLWDLVDDPTIDLWAFNAQFERVMLNATLDGWAERVPAQRWRCSMVLAYHYSFTGNLKKVGQQIGVDHDHQKMDGGRKLVLRFCKPKSDGTWWNRENDPLNWQRYLEYNRQDVVAEQALHDAFEGLPVSETLWDEYWLDQEINDRGVPVDMQMVDAALTIEAEERERLLFLLGDVTGLDNPNSRDQMLGWLQQYYPEIHDLQKATLEHLQTYAQGIAREAVFYRQQLASTATKKYDALCRATGADDRIRGTLQFVGASRTGRWAGRLLQLQNLMRPVVKDTDLLADEIKLNSRDVLVAMEPEHSVLSLLASGVRPALCAPAGKTFAVSDLSAIEGRLAGWFSDCTRMQRVFELGQDPYKDLASEIYGVSMDKVTKDQRHFSKPVALGCFAANTKVLTRLGWLPITEVTTTTELWDGVEWVTSDGVIYQGEKQTLTQYGVTATPDHEILTGEDEWHSWQDLNDGNINLATTWATGGLSPTLTVNGCVTAPVGHGSGWIPNAVVVPTYDILNSGPRHRYTILTDKGPLIAHNCGYLLGAKGLVKYAVNYGVEMDQERAQEVVTIFRNTYFEIPLLWDLLKDAFFRVTMGQAQRVSVKDRLWIIRVNRDYIAMVLPSGRGIFYYQPRIEPGNIPGTDIVVDQFTYMGQDSYTNQWARIAAHPGGMLEAACQATARDILQVWMNRVNAMGLPVVMHVHDEIVAEVQDRNGQRALDALNESIRQPIPWAPGLLLDADGYVSRRYKKD